MNGKLQACDLFVMLHLNLHTAILMTITTCHQSLIRRGSLTAYPSSAGQWNSGEQLPLAEGKGGHAAIGVSWKGEQPTLSGSRRHISFMSFWLSRQIFSNHEDHCFRPYFIAIA